MSHVGVQIYERDVMFRQQVGNLQLIVGIYNNVQGTILPVEKPLITQKLEAVDGALKKGLQACHSSCISFAREDVPTIKLLLRMTLQC